MIDSSEAVEESVERVRELDSWSRGSFDCAWHPDRIVSEESVDSNAVSFEISDVVSDLEASIALVSIVLLSDIVWKLTLVEVNFSIVAVPLNEITKAVLREQTISLDIVRVDLKALSNVVFTVVNASMNVMVSSPEPGVVDEYVLVVDLNHSFSCDLVIIRVVASSDTSEYVSDDTWCVFISVSEICAPFEKSI